MQNRLTLIIRYLVQLQNDGESNAVDMDVKFQLSKDTLDTMLKSMYCIRDQLSDNVSVILENLFFFMALCH